MMQLCFIIMRLLSAFATVIEAFARRVAKTRCKTLSADGTLLRNEQH